MPISILVGEVESGDELHEDVQASGNIEKEDAYVFEDSDDDENAELIAGAYTSDQARPPINSSPVQERSLLTPYTLNTSPLSNQALIALFAKADRDRDGVVVALDLRQVSMRYPGLVAALELPHPDSFVAALDDLGPEPDRKVLHGDLFDLLQRQRQRPRYTGLLARARKAPGYGAGMRPMREVLLRRTFDVIDRRRTERVTLAELMAFGRFMGREWSMEKCRLALHRATATTMVYPPPSRRRPRLAVVSSAECLTKETFVSLCVTLLADLPARQFADYLEGYAEFAFTTKARRDILIGVFESVGRHDHFDPGRDLDVATTSLPDARAWSLTASLPLNPALLEQWCWCVDKSAAHDFGTLSQLIPEQTSVDVARALFCGWSAHRASPISDEQFDTVVARFLELSKAFQHGESDRRRRKSQAVRSRIENPELLREAFQTLEHRTGVVLPADIMDFGHYMGLELAEADRHRVLASATDADAPGISVGAFSEFFSALLAPLGPDVIRERTERFAVVANTSNSSELLALLEDAFRVLQCHAQPNSVVAHSELLVLGRTLGGPGFGAGHCEHMIATMESVPPALQRFQWFAMWAQLLDGVPQHRVLENLRQFAVLATHMHESFGSTPMAAATGGRTLRDSLVFAT